MSAGDKTNTMANPEANWRPMLDARMVQNDAADVARETDGTVVIKVATVRPRWMVPPLRWIVPYKPERILRLDKLGSLVWELCDGRRTVEQIIDRFAERHHLSFHEARVSVTSYLKELLSRGALAVVMD